MKLARSKKKILLLSDDLRMHSGIGTMSRFFVKETIGHYDWVQLGGAIKHPDKGKIADLSESMRKDLKVINGIIIKLMVIILKKYLKLYKKHRNQKNLLQFHVKQQSVMDLQTKVVRLHLMEVH